MSQPATNREPHQKKRRTALHRLVWFHADLLVLKPFELFPVFLWKLALTFLQQSGDLRSSSGLHCGPPLWPLSSGLSCLLHSLRIAISRPGEALQSLKENIRTAVLSLSLCMYISYSSMIVACSMHSHSLAGCKANYLSCTECLSKH